MNLAFTPRILLVDDSKWELEMFHSILSDDCHVDKQSDGAAALDTAKRLDPHLIVLDMIMPGIEGIDVLKELKKDSETKNIPVIMLTAYSSNEDRVVKCIELGACDYLFKPISENILRAKISRAIQMQHTESSLRYSLAYNSHLMNTIQSVIVCVDKNACVSYWNRQAECRFGITSQQAIGKAISSLEVGWNWGRLQQHITQSFCEKKYNYRFDIDYSCRGSGNRILSICISPFVGVDEKAGGYLLLADDITETRVQQSYDHQTERLQSIGQLAAGIAHEINTPIQYVGDNTHFLQESFQELLDVVDNIQRLASQLASSKDVESFKRNLEKLYEQCDYEYLADNVPKAIFQSLEGIDRVSSIVKAMKDFSHPGSDTKDPTDINRAIDSTITVARNVWKYVADLNTELDPQMGELLCYTGPFNEVILNIIVNAAHAIDSVVAESNGVKGLITVKTQRFEHYGEIRISDTGPGIPEKFCAKIFDPFFTTKEVGKGTGQGLSLCHSIIVEQHAGELFFETEEGAGTTFVIRLPIDG